jgi:hypothetical protein
LTTATVFSSVQFSFVNDVHRSRTGTTTNDGVTADEVVPILGRGRSESDSKDSKSTRSGRVGEIGFSVAVNVDCDGVGSEVTFSVTDFNGNGEAPFCQASRSWR